MKYMFFPHSCIKCKPCEASSRSIRSNDDEIVSVGIGRTKCEAVLDGIKHFESIGIQCRGKRRAELIKRSLAVKTDIRQRCGWYYMLLASRHSDSWRVTNVFGSVFDLSRLIRPR